MSLLPQSSTCQLILGEEALKKDCSLQVSAEDGSLGKVAKYALDNAQRPLVITRAFQPVPVAPDA